MRTEEKQMGWTYVDYVHQQLNRMQTIRNGLESVHRDAEVQSEPLTSNRYHQAKRRDPNNPQWLAKQTCWRCGKVGHIHPKCTALQAERDAYYMKKLAEWNAAN